METSQSTILIEMPVVAEPSYNGFFHAPILCGVRLHDTALEYLRLRGKVSGILSSGRAPRKQITRLTKKIDTED